MAGDGAPWLVVVMGVSGSGKTSVGQALAGRLETPFMEGDALHPSRNIDKMEAGIPLEDEDRWPWLDSIGREITAAARDGRGLVVSCSALKKAYRDRLRGAAGKPLSFVFLHGTRALLRERMALRQGHFMPASMLDSQLATLEDPSGEPGVVPADISMTVDQIVAVAYERLERLRSE